MAKEKKGWNLKEYQWTTLKAEMQTLRKELRELIGHRVTQSVDYEAQSQPDPERFPISPSNLPHVVDPTTLSVDDLERLLRAKQL